MQNRNDYVRVKLIGDRGGSVRTQKRTCLAPISSELFKLHKFACRSLILLFRSNIVQGVEEK